MTTRFGFVSTYPPTLCGLATFATALHAELVGDRGDGCVIRLVEQAGAPLPAGVAGQLVAGQPASLSAAAVQLDTCDVVIVQHEYGVFGGPDGDEVLALLAELSVPTVVVLHTVLVDPTDHQRSVLERVVEAADAIVTMTTTARDRLVGYAVDLRKVSVIAHGAPALPIFERSAEPTVPTVLTWGLIGPGKGIEWGIEAFASLADLRPAARYVVAGQTHPKVLQHEGERYRLALQSRIDELGMQDVVHLDARYRDAGALARLVAAADVVLLPYDSTDQVTSGVLIEAVAALKPVVATRFPHAVELLGGGAGLLVPHKDPAAIALALRSLLTDPAVVHAVRQKAAATAPELLWPAVAARYRTLVEQVVRARVAA